MSIKGQGHSLTLVKGHSDFKVKCLTFGPFTQVRDSGPHGPLVRKAHAAFDQGRGFERGEGRESAISSDGFF